MPSARRTRSTCSSAARTCKQPGLRAVPSLTYLQVVPQFTEHYYESDDEGDASVDNGPTGGLTWDGRADRGRDQARIPLLSPFEMANDDEAAVAAKIRQASYAGEFVKIFGDDLFKDDGKTYAAAIEALEVFEQSERDFYPYSSKYDAYLAGRAKLTAQEARGLALFNDPRTKAIARAATAAPRTITARRRNSPITA